MYWFKKITEIKAYLLAEIEERRRQAKKKKRFNKITGIEDIGLITSPAITGGTSIPAFASGVGLPVGAALGVSVSFFPFQRLSHENLPVP